MSLVLDTSAYSQLRRGDSAAIDRLADASIVLVPTVVIGELQAGFALGERMADNAALLEEFLAEAFVETIDVGVGIARRYGRLFAALRKAGTPIPINDVWIAACALHVAAPLLTYDRDFVHVPDLEVVLLGGNG
jgi:tRNA(fMet)-specific endonuclease VapC